MRVTYELRTNDVDTGFRRFLDFPQKKKKKFRPTAQKFQIKCHKTTSKTYLKGLKTLTHIK